MANFSAKIPYKLEPIFNIAPGAEYTEVQYFYITPGSKHLCYAADSS
jgi:hypothetical protein